MRRQTVHAWVAGLLSSIISGAATAVVTMATSPEIVAQLGWMTLLKVSGGAALISAAAFLKQSPIPAETTTASITVTETTTKE